MIAASIMYNLSSGYYAWIIALYQANLVIEHPQATVSEILTEMDSDETTYKISNSNNT